MLYLASASPRRRALLGELGLPFTPAATDIDERALPGETPLDYTRRLAIAKARAAPGRPALGADTTVVLDGRILAKPADAAEARTMLRALRARQHTVVTAVALAWHDPVAAGGGERVAVDHRATLVHMRAYTEAELAAYIATGDPFDKAGGYAIQHRGFAPVAAIEGCYFNVVGLPVCAVRQLLLEAGIKLPSGCADLFAAPPDGVCARCRARRDVDETGGDGLSGRVAPPTLEMEAERGREVPG